MRSSSPPSPPIRRLRHRAKKKGEGGEGGEGEGRREEGGGHFYQGKEKENYNSHNDGHTTNNATNTTVRAEVFPSFWDLMLGGGVGGGGKNRGRSESEKARNGEEGRGEEGDGVKVRKQ